MSKFQNRDVASDYLVEQLITKGIVTAASDVVKKAEDIVAAIPANTRSEYSADTLIAAAEFFETWYASTQKLTPVAATGAPAKARATASKELPALPANVEQNVSRFIRNTEKIRNSNNKNAKVTKLLFSNPSNAGMISEAVVPEIKDMDKFNSFENILADEESRRVYLNIKNAVSENKAIPTKPAKASTSVQGLIALVVPTGAEGSTSLVSQVMKLEHAIGFVLESTLGQIAVDEETKLGFTVKSGKRAKGANVEGYRLVGKVYGKAEAIENPRLHDYVKTALIENGKPVLRDVRLTVGTFKVQKLDENNQPILNAKGEPATRTIRITGKGSGPKWVNKSEYEHAFGKTQLGTGGLAPIVSKDDEMQAQKNIKQLIGLSVTGAVQADSYGAEFARLVEDIQISANSSKAAIADEFQ